MINTHFDARKCRGDSTKGKVPVFGENGIDKCRRPILIMVGINIVCRRADSLHRVADCAGETRPFDHLQIIPIVADGRHLISFEAERFRCLLQSSSLGDSRRQKLNVIALADGDDGIILRQILTHECGVRFDPIRVIHEEHLGGLHASEPGIA